MKVENKKTITLCIETKEAEKKLNSLIELAKAAKEEVETIILPERRGKWECATSLETGCIEVKQKNTNKDISEMSEKEILRQQLVLLVFF